MFNCGTRFAGMGGMGGDPKEAGSNSAARMVAADSRTPEGAAPEKAGLSLTGQISMCPVSERAVSERAVSEPGLGGLVWSVKWQ